jgi:hypothetical protein
MLYNIYKNISDKDFTDIKEELSKLNNLILQSFPEQLAHLYRADESDYLALNFTFATQLPYLGNLAIMYEDLPGKITFSIGIVKALDKGGVRFYKKEDIVENIDIDTLRTRVLDYCESAIQKYQSWSANDLRPD